MLSLEQKHLIVELIREMLDRHELDVWEPNDLVLQSSVNALILAKEDFVMGFINQGMQPIASVGEALIIFLQKTNTVKEVIDLVTYVRESGNEIPGYFCIGDRDFIEFSKAVDFNHGNRANYKYKFGPVSATTVAGIEFMVIDDSPGVLYIP